MLRVETIDFIPPKYLLSRATRLASTALQCSQVASEKAPSGVIAVNMLSSSLGCFQPCFPQDFLQFNLQELLPFFLKFDAKFSEHIDTTRILWEENPHTVAVPVDDPTSNSSG